jgi:hypothetical protein
MRLERALAAAAGFRNDSDTDILNKELVEGDTIMDYHLMVRGRQEILFDDVKGWAFTWLSTRECAEDDTVEFLFGTSLAGVGYMGVPLQKYLLYHALLPFRVVYARVLLRTAVGCLLADVG